MNDSRSESKDPNVVKFNDIESPNDKRGGNENEDENLGDLHRERLRDENTFRKELVRWCKWVVSIHLALVFGILFLVAWGQCQLHNSVLVALLGTTTATVVGLVLAIIKGLFNTKA